MEKARVHVDYHLADAILDRLAHNAHRITLKEESMRKEKMSLTTKEATGQV